MKVVSIVGEVPEILALLHLGLLPSAHKQLQMSRRVEGAEQPLLLALYSPEVLLTIQEVSQVLTKSEGSL